MHKFGWWLCVPGFGVKEITFCGQVETMVCPDCKELMAEPMNLKPLEWKREEYGGTHFKKLYSGRTHGPKSGLRLKQSETFKLWD